MADDSASNGTTTPGTLAHNALITSTDRRGLITVIAAILLSFVLTTFFTRLYIRLRVSGPWRKDDNAVMVATVSLSISNPLECAMHEQDNETDPLLYPPGFLRGPCRSALHGCQDGIWPDL